MNKTELYKALTVNNKTGLLYLKLVLITVLFDFILISCSNKIQKTLVQGDENLINEMVSKIDTTINSDYVYRYEKTKYVPPNEQTLLIMGQTLKNIKGYRNFTNYRDYPAGWSAYWSVTEFSGITEAWTTPSGDTQNHQFLVDKFENMVLHSAMWLVGKWDLAKKTKDGEYDYVIREYSNWAKTVNRPIYLRIGYEFDGPHNEFEPSEYIAAYRHIVDLMRSEGVTNVAFVWHSYASVTYNNYPVSDWYPGDDYVDWVGISVFFQPYNDIFNHKETNDVLNFAKTKKKPVMIAEANPVMGIKEDDDKIWDDWFVDFFSFCYQRNIKAVAFINEDWKRLKIEGIENWEDSKLYNNKMVARAWLKETSKSRYLKQSPELLEQIGYLKNE